MCDSQIWIRIEPDTSRSLDLFMPFGSTSYLQGCGSGRIGTFLIGSGTFPPDPYQDPDPISFLAM